ncbi:MAG: 50S ribosomal protein L13 [bacterium]
MKTVSTKPNMIEKKWYVIDADGQTLGRLATKVSALLIGKHKTYFGSNLDCGDNVIVINTKGIKVTGKKLEDKTYYTYSGYQGGLKSRSLQELNDVNPTKALEIAVKGMLPKNKMGKTMLLKLHLYADSEHKHEAQKPEVLK